MEHTGSSNSFDIAYDPDDEFFGFFSIPNTAQPKSPNIEDCQNKKDEDFLHPLQNAVPELVPELPGNVNVAVTEPVQQTAAPLEAGESANYYQVPSSQESTAASETDNPKFLWQRTAKYDNPKDEKRRLNAIKARRNRVAGKKTVNELQATIKERDELIAQEKTEKEKLTLENTILRTCLNIPQTGRLRLVSGKLSQGNHPEKYLALSSADGQKILAFYKVPPARAFQVNNVNIVIDQSRQNKLQNSVAIARGVVASSGHMMNQAISNSVPLASGSVVDETGPNIVTSHVSQKSSMVPVTPSRVFFQGNKTALNIPTQSMRIITVNPEFLQILPLQ